MEKSYILNKKKMDHHIKLWLKILKMQSMEPALILFI